MARNPNLTTQYQDFMKACYLKEANQRLAWFAKRRSQPKVKPRQLEVFRKKITEGSKPSEALLEKMPALGGEKRYARVVADFNDPLLHHHKPTDFEIQPEMIPPPADALKCLFDGITKEEKGRYQYLRMRNQLNPEDKFSFPTLSSWDYGWRLGDNMKKEEIQKPTFGRNRIVHDTFYTRNGIGVAPKFFPKA